MTLDDAHGKPVDSARIGIRESAALRNPGRREDWPPRARERRGGGLGGGGAPRERKLPGAWGSRDGAPGEAGEAVCASALAAADPGLQAPSPSGPEAVEAAGGGLQPVRGSPRRGRRSLVG